MLSQSILTQSNFSEDQFVADLTSLFKRRKISYGDPKDLEHLGSDLASDEAFRGALFNLCDVISHMTEVEPTPQELLALVARAAGGPPVSDAPGALTIPPNTETAFLTGYESWKMREQDLTAFSKSRHTDPFHTALTLAAADGSRPAPGTLRSTAPNTSIESLTLGELRHYLDEIERRVSRIDPHLEQQAQTTAPSATHIELPHVIEPEKIHEASPPLLVTAPEPAPAPGLAAEPIVPAVEVDEPSPLAVHSTFPNAEAETASAAHAEPGLADLSTIPTEPPSPFHAAASALVTDLVASQRAIDVVIDTARLKRLRMANVILAILLVISVVFASAVTIHYVNSKDLPDTSADRAPAPAGELPSNHATLPFSLRTNLPLSRSKSATAGGHDAKPPQTSQTTSGATVRPEAEPSPGAASSETKPPAPSVRQTPGSASANSSPAEVSSLPPAPTPSESKPTESAPRPEQRTDAPPTRPSPPPTATQVADARPAAPAAAPVAAPIVRTASVNSTLRVPSTKMMAYAISSPQPVPPQTRRNSPETTVEVVAVISQDGRVTSAQALSGTPDARPAAIQAMQAWRFKPYMVDGKPVEVITTFKFLFKSQ